MQLQNQRAIPACRQTRVHARQDRVFRPFDVDLDDVHLRTAAVNRSTDVARTSNRWPGSMAPVFGLRWSVASRRATRRDSLALRHSRRG